MGLVHFSLAQHENLWGYLLHLVAYNSGKKGATFKAYEKCVYKRTIFLCDECDSYTFKTRCMNSKKDCQPIASEVDISTVI